MLEERLLDVFNKMSEKEKQFYLGVGNAILSGRTENEDTKARIELKLVINKRRNN